VEPLGDQLRSAGVLGRAGVVGAVASADSCPSDVRAAASDAAWAADVFESLPDRELRGKTTGMWFADGVVTETVVSGQKIDNDDDPLWVEAKNLLAAAGIAHPPVGAHPAASHVETKAAVWMRQQGVTYAVAVINNRTGPRGEETLALFGCSSAVPALLPAGSTVVVWWWSNRAGTMKSTTYEGTA
jgi:hypothetical protein